MVRSSASEDSGEQAGGGSDSGARFSGAMAAAAAALARPCTPFNSFCHALAVPHWAPDQERRQLRFALLNEPQGVALRQTASTALGAEDARHTLAGVDGAVPSTATRWQQLLRWRARPHTAPAQVSARGDPRPPGSRRVWWSWQRGPAQRQRQQDGPLGVGVQHTHGWQGAPA